MNEYTFDSITIRAQESFEITVTERMMAMFLDITGDVNPLHTDEVFAQESGYRGKVVYGMLTAALFSTLAGVHMPGRYSLIHSVETEFTKAVYPGDKLTVMGVVKEKDDRFRTIELKTTIHNQNGEKVCRGKMKIGVLQ